MEPNHGDTQVRWIHVLFKADSGFDDGDVEDDYIVQFTNEGLTAVRVPIIEFTFINTEQIAQLIDGLAYDRGGKYSNGLILTSPRVVKALEKVFQSTKNKEEDMKKFNPHLIFVVGEKTASCCSSLNMGYNLESVATGNKNNLSELIKTVTHAYVGCHLLYPRSSLAEDSTNLKLATQRAKVTTITAYKTTPIDALHQVCSAKLEKLKIPDDNRSLIINLIFFSPSGVDAFVNAGQEEFLHMLHTVFADNPLIELKFSGIGSTTSLALVKNKLQPFAAPVRPTAESLLEEIKLKMKLSGENS